MSVSVGRGGVVGMACAVWVKDAFTVAKAAVIAMAGSSAGSGVESALPQAERVSAATTKVRKIRLVIFPQRRVYGQGISAGPA